MKHTSLKEYAAVLGRAAEEFLASRDVAATEAYRLQVDACPVHGPACVLVTYGVLRDHFSLNRTDPASVAVDLLTTMLPPESAVPNDSDAEPVSTPMHKGVAAREERSVIPFAREFAN
jgi:hypothetical protein